MCDKIEQLKKQYASIKDKALKDYYKFLQFETISSEPVFKEAMHRCVKWLAEYLTNLEFDVEIWPTQGHPVIFASHLKAGKEQPTLLIYNHYDVQPVDPLELWSTPPFDPQIKEDQVYARGAQDNKGQCFYVLLALKTVIEEKGSLPINIKLCIEGEEECGSLGLSSILAEKKEKLNADYLAVVDLGLNDIKTPAVTLGIRGIVTMDVEVTGTETDLHSGSHGGVAYNPIHALVKLLSMTRDPNGKILIPGFYDDLIPISTADKSKINFNFDTEAYKKSFGQDATGGEQEYSPLERNWLRPTLEINGINGGYTGEGFKTVIPSKAYAKVSCRLVPNQNPEKISHLVASFLESNAPAGCKVDVQVHKGAGMAARSNINSVAVKAYAAAYEEVFGTACEYIYSGASIPIATALSEASGSEIVLVGLGLPDDAIHAPNEHFGLDRIEKGFLVTRRVLDLLRTVSLLQLNDRIDPAE
jgi:acetylornithine deacetylase/succinyl-diaminopimelate desuccinylase-like protein